MDDTAILFAGLLAGAVLAVLNGLRLSHQLRLQGRQRWQMLQLIPRHTAEAAPSRRTDFLAHLEKVAQEVNLPTWLQRFLPETVIVGSGWSYTPLLFWTLTWWIWRLALILALVGLGWLIAKPTLALWGLLILLISMILALAPVVWVRRHYRQRQHAIVRALPDFLDLLALTVEAGLGFEPALRDVAYDFPGPWGDEMRRALRRIDLGVPRIQALREAVERTGVEEARSFVEALYLSQRLGSPLARSLRIQARLLRVRRKQRAQAAAYTAPVRLVPALVFFFLPGLLLLYLAPPLLLFLLR